MHLAKRVWRQENAALCLFKSYALERGCLCQERREPFLTRLPASYALTSNLLPPPTMIPTPPLSSFSSFFSLSASIPPTFGVVTYFLDPYWPISSGSEFTRKFLVWHWPLSWYILTPSLLLLLWQHGLLAMALAALGHRPACGVGQCKQQAEDRILRAGTSASDNWQEPCSVHLMDICRSAALPSWGSVSLGVQHPPGTPRNSCKDA